MSITHVVASLVDLFIPVVLLVAIVLLIAMAVDFHTNPRYRDSVSEPIAQPAQAAPLPRSIAPALQPETVYNYEEDPGYLLDFPVPVRSER